MKIKSLFLLCLLCITACAQRGPEAGDDVPTDPGHDPDPGPDAGDDDECQIDADCVDEVACSVGACENGACVYDTLCEGDEVCDEDTGTCEEPVTQLPAGHEVRCFSNNGTLYVTISGKLTDANYGGSLVAPQHVSIASDAIAGSWNTTTLSTTYKVSLSQEESDLGGLVSGSIAVPEELARRFTLLIWPQTGTAQRFDLSSWNVSGDSCARIEDGSAVGGASDGHIIGRAPLCPSACDDGNASTVDVCTPTGCTHSGAPATNGTLACQESGANTNVTVGGGILSHLTVDGLTPDSSWKICFGYGGSACINWVSDSSSYLLQMPNAVTGFNLVLRNGSGTNMAWMMVSEIDVTGTCARKSDDSEFTHTPPSTPTPTTIGTIRCKLTSETGSLKRKISIIPHASRDIREGLAESPVLLPSPSALQYGSNTDGWTLPYPSGSAKPQLSYVGGTQTYNLYLDTNVDEINFFLTDNDDPSDSVAGGDYFDLAKWTVENDGSAGCSKTTGAISTN